MEQEEPGHGDPIRPWDWLKVIPFQAVAASDRLGWTRACSPTTSSASSASRQA